jgi:hypothetical protein
MTMAALEAGLHVLCEKPKGGSSIAMGFDSDAELHTIVKSVKPVQGIIPEREERC